MTTIKYTVTNYSGIGEFPKVILIDRPAGSFQNQFYSIIDLKSYLGENPTIYFVADKDNNRIDGLGNWNGEKFDYNKLITL